MAVGIHRHRVRREVRDARPEQRVPEGQYSISFWVRAGEEAEASTPRRCDTHHRTAVAD
jgi:hypothetical protein